MKSWLFPIAASVSVLAVTVCLCLALLAARADLVWIPSFAAGSQKAVLLRLDSIQRTVDRAQASMDSLPERVVPPVVRAAQEEVRHGVDSIVGKVDPVIAETAAWRQTVDRRVSDVTDRNGGSLASVLTGIREDLKPTLQDSQKLIQAYAALPDRVSLALQPSWASLEPEITCRQADGSGYGGCWHSRTTALMGEAARVGGVFTQQFPKFTDSLNGIMFDAHAWTAKYIQPRPMKLGDYFKAAGKITIGLGTAGLRGGIF